MRGAPKAHEIKLHHYPTDHGSDRTARGSTCSLAVIAAVWIGEREWEWAKRNYIRKKERSNGTYHPRELSRLRFQTGWVSWFLTFVDCKHVLVVSWSVGCVVWWRDYWQRITQNASVVRVVLFRFELIRPPLFHKVCRISMSLNWVNKKVYTKSITISKGRRVDDPFQCKPNRWYTWRIWSKKWNHKLGAGNKRKYNWASGRNFTTCCLRCYTSKRPVWMWRYTCLPSTLESFPTHWYAGWYDWTGC